MKNRNAIIIIVCFIIVFLSGVYVGILRRIPFIRKQTQWSIGIYSGESPYKLNPSKRIKNPVLTYKNVTDIKADFVADPFMVKENDTWYMFFEVLNSETRKGEIGLATSKNGLDWAYEQIVLREPFHVTYPYIFKWNSEYYMIPETSKSFSIRLYKAIDFPVRWEYVKTLFKGDVFSDSSIFYYDNLWWLFTFTYSNNILKLYYADKPTGPWIEHPNNPIVIGDANIARPGGRVLVYGNRVIRYTQDDEPYYGNQVRAFEIMQLSPSSYKEREVTSGPILKWSGMGWNKDRMHHIDPHEIKTNEWIACVDGAKDVLSIGLKTKKANSKTKVKLQR